MTESPINSLVLAQRQGEEKRIAILESHVAAGVQIPCFDGVMIDKTVKIGTGTQILPGTILRGETTIGETLLSAPKV